MCIVQICLLTIRVFEVLKTKYPNDDIIATSIDILRNEACNMFGGSIHSDEVED